MKRELEFHDSTKLTDVARETMKSFGWFLVSVEILTIVCCFAIGSMEYKDRYKEPLYNEAVRQFNELSLEQRQIFCENLMDTEKLNYLDDEAYIIASKFKAPQTVGEAVKLTFTYLFYASGLFFLIYVLYCLLYGFYLADFPYKGIHKILLLPIFVYAGWPFFLISYLRIRNAKKRNLSTEN